MRVRAALLRCFASYDRAVGIVRYTSHALAVSSFPSRPTPFPSLPSLPRPLPFTLHQQRAERWLKLLGKQVYETESIGVHSHTLVRVRVRYQYIQRFKFNTKYSCNQGHDSVVPPPPPPTHLALATIKITAG